MEKANEDCLWRRHFLREGLLREMAVRLRKSNIDLMDSRKQREVVFVEIMTEKLPELTKDSNPQIPEA